MLKVKDLLLEHQRQIEKLSTKSQALALVVQELRRYSSNFGENEDSTIESILGAWTESIGQLEHLINPIGLPVGITKDGRIETRTFENVAVLLTDIRGFTSLSHTVVNEWKITVFDFLSYCYFPIIAEVVEDYGCHYLNYTGDGLLIMGQERLDPATGKNLSALDNITLCALQLVEVTTAISQVWADMGLMQNSGVFHETGIGISFGRVEVGDPFVPDRSFDGKLLEFQKRFATYQNSHNHHWQARNNFKDRVRGIHALGPTINLASRLQDTDKRMPNHTCIIEKSDCERLSPSLKKLYESLGTVTLPGLGDCEVFGMPRKNEPDLIKLREACLKP